MPLASFFIVNIFSRKCTVRHFCCFYFSRFLFLVRHCLRFIGSLWMVRCGEGEATGVERCGGRRWHTRYVDGGAFVGDVWISYGLTWSVIDLRINLIRQLLWDTYASTWSVSHLRINLIHKRLTDQVDPYVFQISWRIKLIHKSITDQVDPEVTYESSWSVSRLIKSYYGSSWSVRVMFFKILWFFN